MCRAIAAGGRRCPCHNTPAQRNRWAERKRRQRNRQTAVEAHAEILASGQTETGQISRVDELTDQRLSPLSWEQMESLVADLASDEPALTRLITHMDSRESDEEFERALRSYREQEAAKLAEDQAHWASWEAEQASAGLAGPELRPSRRRTRHLTPRQAAREDFDSYAAVQFLSADEECRGSMLNKAGYAAGIKPYSLFTGPYSRVRKYGSDELREWFGRNGRLTVAEYTYQALGDGTGREAAASAKQHHRDEWN